MKLNDHMRIVQVGADPQRAAAFHRFEAVFDHVVKRLLHLVAIELKQRQIRAQFLFDHNFAVLNFGREKANRFLDNAFTFSGRSCGATAGWRARIA